MPRIRLSSRAELLTAEEEELEREHSNSITHPFLYALFIIISGAIFSGSVPTWLLFLLVGLLLLGTFFRAAAMEVVQHRQRLIPADSENLDLPAAPDVLALLRSARVVLLPAIGHEATLQGLEEGLNGQGSMTLAQLAQHIRGMQQNLPPGASLPEPVSEQELAALPTCTYTTRTLASRWQASSTSVARSRSGDTSRCAQGLEGLEQGCAENTISCSICLEDVSAGEQLMTLPCLHQYHVECVKPWLQRKGRHAVCPMCKTPVFL